MALSVRVRDLGKEKARLVRMLMAESGGALTRAEEG